MGVKYFPSGQPLQFCRPKNFSGALSLIVFLVAMQAAFGQNARAGSNPEVSIRDEYDVYSALLNALSRYSKPRLIVVADSTVTRDALELSYDYLQDIKQKAPELLTDFAEKNSEAVLITPNFHTKVRCVLITQDEIDRIFSLDESASWSLFRKGYPGSNGITWLSRVGFDKKKTTAAVYAEEVQGINRGGGYYYILRKVNGKWKVAYREMSWVT